MVTDQEPKTNQETSQETNQETNQESKTNQESSKKPAKKSVNRNKNLDEVRKNPSITQKELESVTGLSRSGVRYIMQQLCKEGVLRRVGSTKKGQWLLTEK